MDRDVFLGLNSLRRDIESVLCPAEPWARLSAWELPEGWAGFWSTFLFSLNQFNDPSCLPLVDSQGLLNSARVSVD